MPLKVRGPLVVCLICSVLTLDACAPPVSSLSTMPAPCVTSSTVNDSIGWIAPSSDRDREESLRGCRAVGPAVMQTASAGSGGLRTGALLVITWNVAIGKGRVEALLHRLVDDERRANRPIPDFVLLLQEAYRAEGAVSRRMDIQRMASELGFNLVYVPSMRHGRASESGAREDRGNAILSTLPLQKATAIELPLARQRRVAIAARIDLAGTALTIVSVHLDTRGTLREGSVFAGPALRERQAEALVQALAATVDNGGPIIIGGDFNSVGGLEEPAIRVMERTFTRLHCGDPITQKWGYPLDHVFASNRAIVQDCERVGQRYGSDHHPLVVRVSGAALEVSRRTHQRMLSR